VSGVPFDHAVLRQHDEEGAELHNLVVCANFGFMVHGFADALLRGTRALRQLEDPSYRPALDLPRQLTIHLAESA
jgi:hypothetical protein